MAKGKFKTQKTVARTIQLDGLPEKMARDTMYNLSLQASGINMDHTHIVWESSAPGPYLGFVFPFKSSTVEDGWIEVEVLWPDGHRAFIRKEYRMGWW